MDIELVNIDEEFRNLLPPIPRDDLTELEQLIDQHGWNEPLIYWENEGILIDGHHRYDIWHRDYRGSKLAGPELVGMHFDSRAEVMEWMVAHQRSRRNWTREERDAIIRKLYAEEVKPKGRPQKNTKNIDSKKASSDAFSEPKPQKTSEKVAESVGVSPRTVERVVSKGKKEEADENQGDAPSIVLDALDQPVPDKLREQHSLAALIEALGRKFDKLKREAAELAEQPGGHHIHMQTIERELKAAKRTLTESRYYTSCPRCKGKGSKCRDCDGSGFLPFAKKEKAKR